MYLNNILFVQNKLGHCYPSVNGINYGLAQCDPAKYSNKPNRQLRLVTPLFLTATIT